MITIYQKKNNIIKPTVLSNCGEIPSDAVWIDLQAPTEDEIKALEIKLAIQIPSKKEEWKNQVLNRLYVQNGVAYMTAAIITKVESPYPRTIPFTFIVTPDYLLTIHEITPTSFMNFAQRLQKSNEVFLDSSYLLCGLLEEIIIRVAHNSEIVVNSLDELSHSIFGEHVLEEKVKKPSQLMKNILKNLGASADLNSKINESLHSISRLINFFKQALPVDKNLGTILDVLVTDTTALTKQSQFLSDKVIFQLDATIGMISIEQNLISKIFSVVTVFFLPPTMVAGIYGMNFQHMPELGLIYGYPLVLSFMFILAITPYLYFRKKGWL
ncbi:MAG: CorA family divalent cation transporter [Alphaproteobacteria bacterium]|jgi:magnesium transporter